MTELETIGSLADSALQAPRSILLFDRVHYNWIHPEMIRRFKRDYGTRFMVVTPRNKIAEQRRQILDDKDELVLIDELEAARDLRSTDDGAEAEIARAYERKYDVCYMRDIVQQDRWVSSYFAGNSQRSYFAEFPPPPLPVLIKQINNYFDFFESAFENRDIDCFIGWPSYSMSSAVVTHIALAKGGSATWLVSGRKGSYLMWSDGPYVGTEFVKNRAEAIGAVDPVPLEEAEPPRDTREAISELDKEKRFGNFVHEAYLISRDYAIWTAQDLIKRRRSKRVRYNRQIRHVFNNWVMNRYVDRNTESDLTKVVHDPFVLFLLPYEPEYPTTSLARHFNDTLAIVKQCALALPAGVRLVVKDHVVGVGNRCKSFFRDLQRFPNIVLAHNSIRGFDLARQAEAIATINGTVGLEAAYYGKEAVLFTENVEYAYMPHVTVVRSLEDLPRILRDVTAPKSDEQRLEIQRAAARHRQAIEELCINVEDIDVFFGDQPELSPEQYDKVFRLLLEAHTALTVRGTKSTRTKK